MSKNPGGTIHERTHYEVLGIEEGATTDEIRSAWRALISDLHPDRVADEAEKERLSAQAAEVNAAYSTLKDPSSRSSYDADLERERHFEQTGAAADNAGCQNDYETPYTGEYSDVYDEEPDWDRMQAEAAEAWERWENPTLRDRLRQGWYEVAHDEIPDSGKLGFMDDYGTAWDGFENSGTEHGVVMFTLPGFSGFMTRIATGMFVILLAHAFATGFVTLGVVLGAFAADIFMCGFGARAARYIAYQAGSGAELTEGQKMISIPAFAIRSLWLGVIQFGALYGVVLFMRWMYHLDQEPSPVEPFIGYGLAALPILWTIAFLAVWISRTIQEDREEIHSYGAGETG